MPLHIEISGQGSPQEIITSLKNIIAGIEEGLMEPKISPIIWEDKSLLTEIYEL